jgi:hypothetical protein
MAFKQTLVSPWPFRERLLLTGGGGSGKTEAVLQIARHIEEGDMYIFDNDYSFAYNRALATTFQDVDERGNVHVHEETEGTWESTMQVLSETIEEADPSKDWLVVDSVTPTWDYVQNWYQRQVYGEDKASHMVALRAQHSDDMEKYHKAMMEDMNWPAVKAEYARLYRMIQKWKGHLILTAEAKALGKKEDDETRMLFGHIGFKPGGEGRLHHVSSTTVFMFHPARGVWKATTAKDRNRDEMENTPIENFAMDYLKDIAGWELKVTKVDA